ncbi:alpha/beta hydrolase [Actinomyces sp. MRS3W]|uniref:alpha/beta fold hydrolase n=1 Tax=Actinomyces sp. MRS3W TaxID=2800796 RepID=UPI0028FCFC21|nr:alpha/beta hydrolase [Actinomyces sp. MRS3W]MDU0347363.1 alpha/beta hydrolase [Actinomyces sp. MRS3W]
MMLALHEWGEPTAPPLLLVHGLTESATAWPDAVAHWSPRYHVLAVDQRGHGISPRWDDAALARAPQTMQEDLEQVLSLMPQPPVVIAHSLGALISLRACAARPDLVRALVLEDAARPTGHWAPAPWFVDHQERFLDAFTDSGAAEQERMRRETSWSDTEIEAWARCKGQVDRHFIRKGTYLGQADLVSAVNRLAVPTLYLAPRHGGMAPDPSEVTNPLVRLVLLDGVGHCVRRDAPQTYHDLVDPFIEEAFSHANQ